MVHENEITKWLIAWFSENTNAARHDIKNNLKENYFESEWIDSLLFINLISDLEKKFTISFSNDEFQNREFATIAGLSQIVFRKHNA
jgi:acyl carrier protein